MNSTAEEKRSVKRAGAPRSPSPKPLACARGSFGLKAGDGTIEVDQIKDFNG
jgi:hypothetical protein